MLLCCGPAVRTPRDFGIAMADLSKRLKGTFWFDHRTDLPQWLSVGIGQTVSEWAVLERELENIIRILIDSEVAHSRILLFRVNTRTRIAIIKALIEFHTLHGRLKRADKTRFVRVQKDIDKEAGNRNLLAHGLWTKRSKSWFVLQTRESRSIPELQPTLESLSRAVLPQSIKITRAKLRSFCTRAVSLSRRLERIAARFERALGPLRYTQPPYTRKRPNYRHPNANRTP